MDTIEIISVCGEAAAGTLDVANRGSRRLQTANSFHFLLRVRAPTENDASLLLRILNSQLALSSTLTAIGTHISTFSAMTGTITGFSELDFFVTNQAGTIVRQKVYYPDWGNTETCISDGNEPDYMRANPSAWVFNTLAGCCARYFSWNQASCLASGGTTVTGTANATNLWFPDWENTSPNNFRCLQDTNTTNPPEYIANNPTSWLRSTVNDCCERYFGWAFNACITASGGNSTAAAGTVQWYVNWELRQCIQDCPASSSNANCGGLRQPWDPLYATASECCSQKLSWLDANICTPTGQV